MATHEMLVEDAEISIIRERQEYNLLSILKPRIMVDGNAWCILYGENLQDGVAGFGDTAYLAVLDFNKQWHRKVGERP